MNAAEIATEAAKLVGGDRAQQHGDKGRNFEATACLWNAYLSIREGGAAAPITGADFAMMMVLAKMSRVHTGSVFNMDNFVDMAGYAACGGEVALQGQPSQPANVEVNAWIDYNPELPPPTGKVDVQFNSGVRNESGLDAEQFVWDFVASWRPHYASATADENGWIDYVYKNDKKLPTGIVDIITKANEKSYSCVASTVVWPLVKCYRIVG